MIKKEDIPNYRFLEITVISDCTPLKERIKTIKDKNKVNASVKDSTIKYYLLGQIKTYKNNKFYDLLSKDKKTGEIITTRFQYKNLEGLIIETEEPNLYKIKFL